MPKTKQIVYGGVTLEAAMIDTKIAARMIDAAMNADIPAIVDMLWEVRFARDEEWRKGLDLVRQEVAVTVDALVEKILSAPTDIQADEGRDTQHLGQFDADPQDPGD